MAECNHRQLKSLRSDSAIHSLVIINSGSCSGQLRVLYKDEAEDLKQ
jgi:hypothetical protein